MRRRRHNHEPFRSPDHHPRLEKFPAGVEDRHWHAREPHFRIDQLLRFVRKRRLGDDCHERLAGRFEIQPPVGAGVFDTVHHASDFDEQAVVGSAEEPLGIGLAGRRQRLGPKHADLPRQHRWREAAWIDRAVDLDLVAHVDSVWDAVAFPHAAFFREVEVDIDARGAVLDNDTVDVPERHHAADSNGRVGRQLRDGKRPHLSDRLHVSGGVCAIGGGRR